MMILPTRTGYCIPETQSLNRREKGHRTNKRRKKRTYEIIIIIIILIFGSLLSELL